MAKGFKDENGKFRPTGNKKVRDVSNNGDDVEVNISIDNVDELEEFAREKAKMEFAHGTYLTQPIFKFDNAPEDVKRKILEKQFDINLSNLDTLTWGDWLLDYDIFKWNENKIYYDLDRGQYIQFEDLEVKDEDKFRKLLGIPKSTWDKVHYEFINKSYGGNSADSTKISFDENDPYDGKFTDREKEILERAEEKFDDIIHDAWVGLQKQYEYLQSEEAIVETIKANDYDFDESGDIV